MMHLYGRLLRIIGKEFRRRMLWVLLLTALVALLEFVSVGGMFPLLTALVQPGGGHLHTTLGTSLPGLSLLAGVPVLALASILLAVLVIKPLVTAYALREGFRFCFDVQVAVSYRMLVALLRRDYAFFLGENTAVLLRDMTTEVQMFIGGVLLPLIQLVTQLVILLTVVATVAWISPIAAALAFGAVGGLTASLYLFINRKVSVWGKQREARQADMNRVIHQAFAGIKTVKAYGVEPWYLGEFHAIAREYATLNTWYQSAAAVPPLLIELVLFGGGMAGLVYAAASGADIVRFMPTVGVLVLAGYRILAATRAFFTQLVTIRYNWASAAVLERSLERTAPETFAPPVLPEPSRTAVGGRANAGAAGVAFDDVRFRYASAECSALDGVSFRIAPGEHVAIVGGSGAGKTTMVDLLLGLLEPSGGTVIADGTPLTHESAAAWRSRLAYVPQQVFLADVSLRRNIAFGVPAGEIDEARLRQVVEQVRLAEFVARLPEGLDTRLGENGARVSGGERQRIGIARALYRGPALLVLDEATSALDAITERAVNTEVLDACAGVTVVVIAHRLSTVRACDRLILVQGGRVACEGTYDEVVAASEEFARMHSISFAQSEDMAEVRNSIAQENGVA